MNNKLNINVDNFLWASKLPKITEENVEDFLKLIEIRFGKVSKSTLTRFFTFLRDKQGIQFDKRSGGIIINALEKRTVKADTITEIADLFLGSHERHMIKVFTYFKDKGVKYNLEDLERIKGSLKERHIEDSAIKQITDMFLDNKGPKEEENSSTLKV